MESLDKSRDHIAEQIRLLKDAGVDFLILETFFHLAEIQVALNAPPMPDCPPCHHELPSAHHQMQRRVTRR